MTEDEVFERFGLTPASEALPEIRSVLRDATRRERAAQGAGDTEALKFCCVYLFAAGQLDDVFLVWDAKQASFDASISIEVQLLCGDGLAETKAYLASLQVPQAVAALDCILSCEKSGEFEDFSVSELAAHWQNYYRDLATEDRVS